MVYFLQRGLICLSVLIMIGCEHHSRSQGDLFLDTSSPEEFRAGLLYLGEVYLSSEKENILELDAPSLKYFSRVFDRFVSNNELLLKKSPPHFYLLKNNVPFLFSLPGNQYFFSSGLFLKHLKSEELFIAAFSSEVIRSSRDIYEKRAIVPVGHVTTEKTIQMLRLAFETKKLLNEWSYSVLKRAGYDASVFLNWIQVMNRNNLDFALYLGEMTSINKEEQVFKNFLTSQGVTNLQRKVNEANSSQEYYQLLRTIEKEANETRTVRKNSRRRTFQKNTQQGTTR